MYCSAVLGCAIMGLLSGFKLYSCGSFVVFKIDKAGLGGLVIRDFRFQDFASELTWALSSLSGNIVRCECKHMLGNFLLGGFNFFLRATCVPNIVCLSKRNHWCEVKLPRVVVVSCGKCSTPIVFLLSFEEAVLLDICTKSCQCSSVISDRRLPRWLQLHF